MKELHRYNLIPHRHYHYKSFQKADSDWFDRIRCDISESFLTAVERGDKSITSKTLFKICTGANITPNYIILGSEKGYEMDIILELFNGLDQKYQPLAVKLLSAYVEAVNMPK